MSINDDCAFLSSGPIFYGQAVSNTTSEDKGKYGQGGQVAIFDGGTVVSVGSGRSPR
jgi:hypothetical protein